jgi:thiol-disulfide isomerase/thioredoxin
MKRIQLVLMIGLIVVLLSACGGASAEPTGEVTAATSGSSGIVQEEDGAMPAGDEMNDEEMEGRHDEMAEMPDEGMSEDQMDEDMDTTDDGAGASSMPATDEMASHDTASDDMADDDMPGEEMDDMSHDGDMATDTEASQDDASMDAGMDVEEGMETEPAGDDGMMDEEEATMPQVDLAPWQQVVLTNAQSGEQFTLGDFGGKTVFVEPMATWCTNCRIQLTNLSQAQAQLGNDVILIALSVETTISDADLAAYQQRQGFDWTFAVMTPELLQLLVDEFGRVTANPPSTPHFLIRPDNSFTELVTGIDTADELLQMIQAAAG